MSELLSFVLGQGDQFRRQRLPSLYADFSLQRQSNPDGYAANTSAWVNVLGKAAQAGLIAADGCERDTLSLRTGDYLLRALETKDLGRPLALGSAIDDAVSQRRMIPYAYFLAAHDSIYHRTWRLQPWWLLSWGLRQLGLGERSTTTGTLPAGRFVIVENVEEAARKVLRQMGKETNEADRIHPISHFRAETAKVLGMPQGVTDGDLRVILRYLERDESAIVYNDQIVKFKNPGGRSTEITDQDRTVSSLKFLMANLNVQVEQLCARIATLSGNAQTAITNKNRASAAAALRSKKLNETILSQRTGTLSQLEEIYSKIEQAADQVSIVRIMKDSTAVLQNLHAEVGGIDHVEDVAENLRDEMSKVDEVSNVLRSEDLDIDESAVDEELEAMEKQARLDEDKKQALETETRLASIDEVEKAAKAPALKRLTSADIGSTLGEGNIEALKRLSLDEKASPGAKESIPT